MIPVVQIVEELIQLQALLKSRGLGDLAVVGGVEGATEAPKHAGYCQLIFRVAIERSWVKNDGPRGILCYVSSPEVSVEQGWDDVQIKEQTRDLQLRGGKATSENQATHVGGVHALPRVAAHGHAWLRQGDLLPSDWLGPPTSYQTHISVLYLACHLSLVGLQGMVGTACSGALLPAEQTRAQGHLCPQPPSPACPSGAECAAGHRMRPSPSASHSPAQATAKEKAELRGTGQG